MENADINSGRTGDNEDSLGVGRGLRSPGYPSINLKIAIDRARTLKEYNPSRKPLPIDAALKYLGYSPRSGAGMQMIASLKKFGLVEDSGSLDTRSVRVSDLAHRILVDNRPVSPDRDALIRQAALAPKLHAEIRERWEHGLPDDTTLHHWLASEKAFNEKYIAGFLATLRETFEFAKLDSEPSLVDNDDVQTLVSGQPVPVRPRLSPGVDPNDGSLPLPVMTKDGALCVVHIPLMDEQQFAFFKAQLDAYKSFIVRPNQASST